MTTNPKRNIGTWISQLIVPFGITIGIVIGGDLISEWGDWRFFLKFAIVYLATLTAYVLIGCLLRRLWIKHSKQSS